MEPRPTESGLGRTYKQALEEKGEHPLSIELSMLSVDSDLSVEGQAKMLLQLLPLADRIEDEVRKDAEKYRGQKLSQHPTLGAAYATSKQLIAALVQDNPIVRKHIEGLKI